MDSNSVEGGHDVVDRRDVLSSDGARDRRTAETQALFYRRRELNRQAGIAARGDQKVAHR